MQMGVGVQAGSNCFFGFGSFPDLATPTISRKLRPAVENHWQAVELPLRVVSRSWPSGRECHCFLQFRRGRSVITFRLDRADIVFTGWQDVGDLIAGLEQAFGVKSRRRRFLIYLLRVEFEVQGETVPLFVDEDGSAHLEMRKNSESTREAIIARLVGCNRFGQ